MASKKGKSGGNSGDMNLSIRLKAEVQGFSRSINAARKSLEKIQEELGKTAKNSLLAARAMAMIEREAADSNKELKEQIGALASAVSQARADMQALQKELLKTARASVDSAKRIDGMERELHQVTQSAKETARSINRIQGAVSAFKAAIAGLSLALVVRELYQTATQLDKFNVLMQTATGSARLAADEMAFVKRAAYELGLGLEPTIAGYAKLLSTIENTPLEGRGREMFLGISEAIRGFRLAGDDAEGVWRALIQVMSKGTVQADELRGQLGERIPGAFRIAAEAMGVTQRELSRMMDRGELLSEQFMPRFIARLREVVAESAELSRESPDAKLARLGNAFLELKRAILDAGIQPLLESIVDGLAAVTRAAATFIDRARGIAAIPAGAKSLDEQIREKEADIQRTLDALLQKRRELAREMRDPSLFGPDPQELQAAIQALELYMSVLNRQLNDLIRRKQETVAAKERKLTEQTEKTQAQKEADQLRQLIAQLDSQRMALGLTEEQALLYQVSLKLAEVQNEALAEEVWKTATALADQSAALREAAEQQALYARLFPEAKAFDDYAEGLNRLARMYRVGKIDEAEYQEGIDRLTEAYLGLGKATERVAKKTGYAAEAFKATAKGLQGLFASTFDRLMQDGLKGFSSFGQKLLDLFRGILARMAAMAIARPVIIPMVAGLGGLLGMSKEAIAGVTKELGGGAGAAAANPLLGLGLIAGGVAIGALVNRRRRREAEVKKTAAALDLIDSQLRILAGTSTESAERLRRATEAIARATDPREQARLIVERYKLEKQLLEETKTTLDGLVETAKGLSQSLQQDRLRLAGQPDYRPPEQIRASVTALSSLLEMPSIEAYRQARETANKNIAELRNDIEAINEELRTNRDPYKRADWRVKKTAEIFKKEGQIAAEQQRVNEALGEYVAQLKDWAETAKDGMDRLAELRDETLRYYEAQQRLADGLTRSVDLIDAAIARMTDLTRIPSEQVNVALNEWRAKLAEARVLQGQELVDAISELSSAGEQLVNQAREVYGSGARFSDIFGEVRAGLTDIRALADQQGLEAQTAADDAQAILDDIAGVMNDMKTGLDTMSADIVRAIREQKNGLIDELQSLREAIEGQPIEVQVTLDGDKVADSTINRARERSRVGETILYREGVA